MSSTIYEIEYEWKKEHSAKFSKLYDCAQYPHKTYPPKFKFNFRKVDTYGKQQGRASRTMNKLLLLDMKALVYFKNATSVGE